MKAAFLISPQLTEFDQRAAARTGPPPSPADGAFAAGMGRETALSSDGQAQACQMLRDVYALAGLPIDAVGIDEALQRIEHSVNTRERLFISTPNSNFTVAAQSDVAFRRSVQLSDLVVPDGMPLVVFARMLRLPVRGRVTGADLFEQLLARAKSPVRVYFFGGPEGAAAAAQARVNDLGGQVVAVGHASPGFVPVEAMSDQATIDHINAARPDFVVVALGSKKGQAWIMRNQARLSAPVISHLGAVVNFTAGSVRRAPQWVQSIGAEWLWRIYQEPVLWRRYWDDGRVMLNLFARCVLPELPAVWLHRHDDRSAAAVHLKVSPHPGGYDIAMSGQWREVGLGELQRVLMQAIEAKMPVVIDASKLEGLDARVTGTFLLAEARLPSLRIAQAGRDVRRQLDRQRAAYLLAD